MKRILCILLNLFSAAFLTGAYLIQYFTMRKLGMNRFVVYQQMKWQKRIPVDLLKYVALLLALFLTVYMLVRMIKRWEQIKHRSQAVVQLIVLVVLTLYYAYFTVFMNKSLVRSYYLMMPMIGLAVLMQLLANRSQG